MEETAELTDSQPVDDVIVTSEPAPELSVTAEKAPITEPEAAEEVNQEEPKKYTGKYESVDELEKGYTSQGKFVHELSEKVKELENTIAQKAEQENMYKLEQAKSLGFNSYEEAQIEEQTKLTEYQYYSAYSANLPSESQAEAAQLLTEYSQSGNRAILNEIKSLFPPEIVEAIAVEVNGLKGQLLTKLEQQKIEEEKDRQNYLFQEIEEKHKDFLTDIDKNKAKASALASMLNLGAIRSFEDMQAFVDLYHSIEQQVLQNYTAEQEARKDVNAIKDKAIVPTGDNSIQISDSTAPTYSQISRMTQAEYNNAVKEWGLEKIINAK